MICKTEWCNCKEWDFALELRTPTCYKRKYHSVNKSPMNHRVATASKTGRAYAPRPIRSANEVCYPAIWIQRGLKMQPASMHENDLGLSWLILIAYHSLSLSWLIMAIHGYSWLILMMILDDIWAQMIYHPCPCPCSCPAPDDSRPERHSANGIARMSV